MFSSSFVVSRRPGDGWAGLSVPSSSAGTDGRDIRLTTWHLCNPPNNGVQGFLNHQQYLYKKNDLGTWKGFQWKGFEETIHLKKPINFQDTKFLRHNLFDTHLNLQMSVLLSQELTSAWQVCFWVEGNSYFQMSLFLSRKPSLFCMGLEDNIMYS